MVARLQLCQMIGMLGNCSVRSGTSSPEEVDKGSLEVRYFMTFCYRIMKSSGMKFVGGNSL